MLHFIETLVGYQPKEMPMRFHYCLILVGFLGAGCGGGGGTTANTDTVFTAMMSKEINGDNYNYAPDFGVVNLPGVWVGTWLSMTPTAGKVDSEFDIEMGLRVAAISPDGSTVAVGDMLYPEPELAIHVVIGDAPGFDRLERAVSHETVTRDTSGFFGGVGAVRNQAWESDPAKPGLRYTWDLHDGTGAEPRGDFDYHGGPVYTRAFCDVQTGQAWWCPNTLCENASTTATWFPHLGPACSSL